MKQNTQRKFRKRKVSFPEAKPAEESRGLGFIEVVHQ